MDKLICNRKCIEKRIGYTFKNVNLLYQAFVRPSFSKEYSVDNFNTLKFIGINVLDYYSTKILIKKFGITEGNDDLNFIINIDNQPLTLPILKQKLTTHNMLVHYIDLLGVKNYILKGDINEDGSYENMYLAKKELFYTILGAIAIDSNFCPTNLNKSVNMMLNIDDNIEMAVNPTTDYLELINKWHEKEHSKLPRFIFEKLSNGNYKCIVELKTKRGKLKFIEESKGKLNSQRQVAEKAYKSLLSNDEIFTIKDELPNELTLDNSVDTLEQLFFKGYISVPKYNQDFEPEYNKGELKYRCDCSILSNNITYTAYGYSKKEAKKYAAYLCLTAVCHIKDTLSDELKLKK